MEYKILQAEYAEKLSIKVNEAISNGWKPQGGVIYFQDTETWTNERKGYQESNTDSSFFQAMIKP